MVNPILANQMIKMAEGGVLDLVAGKLTPRNVSSIDFHNLKAAPSEEVCMQWVKDGTWEMVSAIAGLSPSSKVLRAIAKRDKRKSVLEALVLNPHLSDDDREILVQRSLKLVDLAWLTSTLIDTAPGEIVLSIFKRQLEVITKREEETLPSDNRWAANRSFTHLADRISSVDPETSREIFDFLYECTERVWSDRRSLLRAGLRNPEKIGLDRLLKLMKSMKENRILNLSDWDVESATRKNFAFFLAQGKDAQLELLSLKDPTLNRLFLEAELKGFENLDVSFKEILNAQVDKNRIDVIRNLAEREGLLVTAELAPAVYHCLGERSLGDCENLNYTQEAVEVLFDAFNTADSKSMILLKSQNLAYKVEQFNSGAFEVPGAIVESMTSAAIIELLNAGMVLRADGRNRSPWVESSFCDPSPEIVSYALQTDVNIPAWYYPVMTDSHIDVMLEKVKRNPQESSTHWAKQWTHLINSLAREGAVEGPRLYALLDAIGCRTGIASLDKRGFKEGEMTALLLSLSPESRNRAEEQITKLLTALSLTEMPPWANEALELISMDWASMNRALAEVVYNRFSAEFGTDVHRWETALTLIESWTGTLPDVIQAAKSLA